MINKGMRSNIWKLYIIKAVGSFSLLMPVITLFFMENGLNMRDIFILQALFSMSVITLEVPTGYFSDKIGRKISIIIGYLFSITGYFAYSLASGFWSFVGAEILLGFGCSFVSESDSSLLYESLLEIKMGEDCTRLEGRRLSMGLASESIAGVLGGLIAILGLRFPLYCETAVLITALPIIFSINEPTVRSTKDRKLFIADIISVAKDIISGGNGLKWVIIYSSIIGTATLNMVWIIQPYLKEVEVPIGFFGVIWSGLMLSAAIVSWNSERIEIFFGRRKIIISLVFLVSAGYFTVVYTWSSLGIVFIGLFFITRGIHDPIIRSHINGKISSRVRATVLSFRNMISRILFSIVGPFIGWISDTISLKYAIFCSGVVFSVSGMVLLFLIHRNKVI